MSHMHTKRVLSRQRLRRLVSSLVEAHKSPPDDLQLAVWYGEKENTDTVHLLEVFKRMPDSPEGKLDEFEFSPSLDFPAHLLAYVVSPGDIERAISKKDPELKSIIERSPEVMWKTQEGERLWRKACDVFTNRAQKARRRIHRAS